MIGWAKPSLSWRTIVELTDALKALFIETANTLKGPERRRFMARTVQQLEPRGQRRAERELGWNRQTIRKALRELTTGRVCLDAFSLRRRKRAEGWAVGSIRQTCNDRHNEW